MMCVCGLWLSDLVTLPALYRNEHLLPLTLTAASVSVDDWPRHSDLFGFRTLSLVQKMKLLYPIIELHDLSKNVSGARRYQMENKPSSESIGQVCLTVNILVILNIKTLVSCV